MNLNKREDAVRRGAALLAGYCPPWPKLLDLKKLSLTSAECRKLAHPYGDYVLAIEGLNRAGVIARG